MIGQQVRFFSEKVFGVWVEATVVGLTKTRITLSAYHQGKIWRENRPRDLEMYYPHGHPEQGMSFRIVG